MSTQVTLTIPDNIYQQAETIAKSTNRPVTEVLTDTILSAFPPLHVDEQRAAMRREVAAFEAMHATFQKTSTQYSIPACARIPCSLKGCLISRISVTRSA